MSILLEQADARSTVFDDCMLCVCFCQTAAALLGIGQCKQFYKDFLGLLKRANYAKQNKHIVKFSSHRHKYHRTSWLCGMKGFACGAGNVISQSSSIPGPLHSRTCTDPEDPPYWAYCSSVSSQHGRHPLFSGAGASRR